MTDSATILVVDDEPLGQETLQALLTPLNCRLTFASNGADALRLAHDAVPDLILLDVMMPGMDGFEVCRRLRADSALAEVPVIMLTALDDRDSRLQGIEAGADDFVSKPYDRMELRARVRTITRLNRYRRLLNARARFEWVVEQADDGYLIADAAGTISYANARARTYLGVAPDGELGRTLPELVEKQYHLQPYATWAEWFAPSAPKRAAPRLLVRPASDEAGLFMLQVDVLGMAPDPDQLYLLQLRDVTATVANQHSVWSFQSQVQHKLRTSLAQLLGVLRLIDGLHLASQYDSTLADLLAIVSSGANALHSDIDDILRYTEAPDLASVTHGRCALSLLPELLEEINAMLGIAAVRILDAPAGGLGDCELALSRRGLRLILSELLENSRKFHPSQQPTVTIEVDRSPDAVRLRVSDDGRSLAPDQLTRAWAPYYQGERFFTGQVPGMGLGLPAVASLIWGIGGSCRLSNCDPGPGVAVELTIPVVPQ
jgi:CheY-like chemotaxis protein